MEKLKIKYNSGMGAILCSKCNKIIKLGYEYNEMESAFSRGEIDYMPPQYCGGCESENTPLESQT